MLIWNISHFRLCKTAATGGLTRDPDTASTDLRILSVETRRTPAPTERFVIRLMIDRQSYPALSVSTDKLHFQAAGARKALATKWTTLSTPASLPNMMFGSNASDQSMLNPETPSKSLLGTDTSNSMLFSPPSILKVTNGEQSIYLRNSVLSRLICGPYLS